MLTQILLPANYNYTTVTSLIPITAADNVNAVSDTDGTQTITYSSISKVYRTMPTSWTSWGPTPYTEGDGDGLRLIYINGFSINITLTIPMAIFGLEAQPDVFGFLNITIQVFNGATSLGSFTRNINGSAQARLLAVSSDVNFNKVKISCSDSFGIARFRYGATAVTPVVSTSDTLFYGA